MPGKCRSFVDTVCFAFRIDVVTKCVRGQSTVDRSKNFVSRLFGFRGFDPTPYPDSAFEVINHHGILPYCIHFAAGNQLDLSLKLYILCTYRPEKIDNILVRIVNSITLHINSACYSLVPICFVKNFE